MAATFRKILCPVDFSDNSMSALAQAAKLARRDDALLYLLHVEFVPMSNPAKLAEYFTVSTEPGRLWLEQIAQKHLLKVRHEVLEQIGWPAEVIRKAAQDLDVDLIVIARHGRTGLNRLFLGSVAEHVVRRSERSVLSFGPGTTLRTLKKILCLVDFDPNSLAALSFGQRLAQEYKATMSLLHVVPAHFQPSEVPAKKPMREWERDVRAQLAKVAATNLGGKANWKLLMRRGDPVTAILEVEKTVRPDLLVMATHEQTGLSHLVFGSVAERMVRESTVPVLTVRELHNVA